MDVYIDMGSHRHVYAHVCAHASRCVHTCCYSAVYTCALTCLDMSVCHVYRHAYRPACMPHLYTHPCTCAYSVCTSHPNVRACLGTAHASSHAHVYVCLYLARRFSLMVGVRPYCCRQCPGHSMCLVEHACAWSMQSLMAGGAAQQYMQQETAQG